MIRTIIIDDEPLARDRVRTLLSHFDDFSLVGEAKNGREALKLIEKKKPDLIFLDIQMPAMDGFKVLDKLENLPMFVFITAYEQYALKAFDVEATDYLLKPYDDERFEQSIDRVRDKFSQRESLELRKQLLSLVKTYDTKASGYIDSIEFTENGFERKIDVEDILYMQADGNYVRIAIENEKHPTLYRATLSSMEESLQPGRFLRIHRGIIINTSAVEKCKYIAVSEYEFTMKDNVKFESSKPYKEKIQALFSDK